MPDSLTPIRRKKGIQREFKEKTALPHTGRPRRLSQLEKSMGCGRLQDIGVGILNLGGRGEQSDGKTAGQVGKELHLFTKMTIWMSQ